MRRGPAAVAFGPRNAVPSGVMRTSPRATRSISPRVKEVSACKRNGSTLRAASQSLGRVLRGCSQRTRHRGATTGLSTLLPLGVTNARTVVCRAHAGPAVDVQFYKDQVSRLVALPQIVFGEVELLGQPRV